MPRPELPSGDRVVVKIGTTSLTSEGGEPEESRVAGLVGEVATLRERGIEIVLVSSGAIAAGLGPLGITRRPSDIPSLQAAAAVGQGRLLRLYNRVLEQHGLQGAQILLTRDDEDRHIDRGKKFRRVGARHARAGRRAVDGGRGRASGRSRPPCWPRRRSARGCRAARSRMPSRRKRPSSSIRTVTSACPARACFATLVRASETRK